MIRAIILLSAITLAGCGEWKQPKPQVNAFFCGGVLADDQLANKGAPPGVRCEVYFIPSRAAPVEPAAAKPEK